MLKNYIKIAWRNLTQYKSYTLINLSGLAVAMACCILISLYVKEELSFDSFHDNADRIVAMGVDGGFGGRSLSTPYPLADALEADIPEVKQTVRTEGTDPLNLSADGQNYSVIGEGKYAEPSFFEVFSFDLIAGDEDNALSSPHSIILSESSSRQIFGDKNPIGQTIYWQKRDTLINFEVTGIIEDEPRNSSIGYNAIISFNSLEKSQRDPEAWTMFRYGTYALLQSRDALKSVPAKFDTLANNRFPKHKGSSYDYEVFSVPLSKLYLSKITNDKGFTGNRAYVFLFGSVALFILLIACVNYVNLSTARASLRSKEVGVRKTLGASRTQVAGQFIGESVIISTAAYVLGWVIAQGLLPFFNQLFGTSIEWQSNIEFLIILMLAAIGVGMAAGLYPSLYLSGFAPSKVLKNQKSSGGSGSYLRKSLVVVQFAIALVLIMGSMIVYHQLQYTQTKDLGFEGKQVLMVDLPNKEAWGQREIIKSELANYSSIKIISFAAGAPGEFNMRMGKRADRLAPESTVKSEETLMFAPAAVDYNFLDVLEIELVAGRNFSRERGADAGGAYIINEKGAKLLGWSPEEAIGKTFNMGSQGKIVGVTEDFHISSLHDDIDAVVLQLQESKSFFSSGLILAKLEAGEITPVLGYLKSKMKEFAPHQSFSYEFLDEKFEAMYRTDLRLGKVIGIFTLIAILIACLGLYGLAAFATQRRVKEIGVRKVLGATIINIVGLLSKDFLKLVVIGFVIAVPIAWYAMNQWLADFAYKIEIGPGIFLLAGGLALLIALATVSWQSVKAALANPVDSLRSE